MSKKMKSVTLGSVLAVTALTLAASAHALNQVTEKEIATFLKNSDSLSAREISVMDNRLMTNYVFNKIQACYEEKFKPYADKEKDEAAFRKSTRFAAECRLKFFKEDTAFQKSADIKARKETERLLAPSADDISADDARAAVMNVMKIIPRKKFRNATVEICIHAYNEFENREDFQSSRQFLNGGGIVSIASVEEALNRVDPVEIYRATKRIVLLGETVWPKKPSIVEVR